MAKATAKPKAKAKPKATPPAKALSQVEQDATNLLASNDAGEVDNVWDVLDDLTEIEKKLPKTAAIRGAWDAFYAECMTIIESSGTDE